MHPRRCQGALVRGSSWQLEGWGCQGGLNTGHPQGPRACEALGGLPMVWLQGRPAIWGLLLLSDRARGLAAPLIRILSQVQTRSSDEPMTTFVVCNECGNRWKVRGSPGHTQPCSLAVGRTWCDTMAHQPPGSCPALRGLAGGTARHLSPFCCSSAEAVASTLPKSLPTDTASLETCPVPTWPPLEGCVPHLLPCLQCTFVLPPDY